MLLALVAFFGHLTFADGRLGADRELFTAQGHVKELFTAQGQGWAVHVFAYVRPCVPARLHGIKR
jgi:hypothetical protein